MSKLRPEHLKPFAQAFRQALECGAIDRWQALELVYELDLAVLEHRKRNGVSGHHSTDPYSPKSNPGFPRPDTHTASRRAGST